MATLKQRVASLADELPSVSLPTQLPDMLASWSRDLDDLRKRLSELWAEVSGGEGSTYRAVLDSRNDRVINPELEWEGHVRLTGDVEGLDSLAPAERAYLRNRRTRIVAPFAAFIGVPASEVDEQDVPVLGIAGSGGGLRAAVNTIGVLRGASNIGVLDFSTYVAGVSGSCWALNVYYSLAEGRMSSLVDHFRSRIVTPFLHPSSLDLLTSSPTARYLLSGAIIKSASSGGEVSLVDACASPRASSLITQMARCCRRASSCPTTSAGSILATSRSAARRVSSTTAPIRSRSTRSFATTSPRARPSPRSAGRSTRPARTRRGRTSCASRRTISWPSRRTSGSSRRPTRSAARRSEPSSQRSRSGAHSRTARAPRCSRSSR